MKNRFNETVSRICDYYSDRGKSMELLSQEIGISKRTLQHWKNNYSPQKETMKLLCKFLKNNDGEQFLSQLECGRLIPADDGGQRTAFPDWLKDEDRDIIRENFPKVRELSLLCAIIVCQNIPEALKAVLPNGTIPEQAILLSGYDDAMKRGKTIFGIENIYDWKDKVIKFIPMGMFPEKDGDIESIGQTALDNIIAGYLCKNGKLDILRNLMKERSRHEFT